MIGRLLGLGHALAMVFPALLVMIVAIGGVSGELACVKEQPDNQITINGGCKSINVTLEVSVEDVAFEMTYNGNNAIPPTMSTLKIGGCTVEGKLAASSGGVEPNWLPDRLAAFYFPITGTTNQNGTLLKDATHNNTFPCQAEFTKTKSGSLIVPIGLQSTDPLPKLDLALKNAKLYKGDVDEAGGWKVWSIVGGVVVGVLLVIASIIVGIYFSKKGKKKGATPPDIKTAIEKEKTKKFRLKKKIAEVVKSIKQPKNQAKSSRAKEMSTAVLEKQYNELMHTAKSLEDPPQQLLEEAPTQDWPEEAVMGDSRACQVLIVPEEYDFSNVNWEWPVDAPYTMEQRIRLFYIFGKDMTPTPAFWFHYQFSLLGLPESDPRIVAFMSTLNELRPRVRAGHRSVTRGDSNIYMVLNTLDRIRRYLRVNPTWLPSYGRLPHY